MQSGLHGVLHGAHFFNAHKARLLAHMASSANRRFAFRLLSIAGVTVVGMTGCPEVILACEAGLRYASIALIVNPAAGVSNEKITMEDISKVLKTSTQKVIDIFDRAIVKI